MSQNKIIALTVLGILSASVLVSVHAEVGTTPDVNYLHLLPSNDQISQATEAERAKLNQPAASQKMPTSQEIQAEKNRYAPIAKETVDEAARRAAGRVQVPTTPSMKVYGDSAHSPDPTELATKYLRAIQAKSGDAKNAPVAMEWQSKAYVFISTSMPMESLVQLGKDAKKIGIPLVIRGIPNGVSKADWQAFHQLMRPVAATGVELLIHPAWFERYRITAVPALVVAPNAVEGCNEGRCEAGSIRVLGDTSLELSLEEVGRRSMPNEAGKLAEKLLATLRERGQP